jgi:hypothetical protein
LGKPGKDPSLNGSTVEFTTAMKFSFSKFGKDTDITIKNDVLKINGDYSHYNIGTYNRGGGGEEPDSFALTVEKVWEDAEGLTINPPGDISITINVLKGGQLTDLSATFPEDDETPWSHTFEGLEEGKYSVEEATVPSGFSVFYSPEEVYLSANNAADTIVVTNTEDGDEPGEPESYEL